MTLHYDHIAGDRGDKAKPLHVQVKTRFGPNRVAADMEGDGEFDFWLIY